jgi:hypothetical protein
MGNHYLVEWRELIKANSPEQAAEIAAAILFDQSQEHLMLKVNTKEVELINGVAHSNQNQNQTK